MTKEVQKVNTARENRMPRQKRNKIGSAGPVLWYEQENYREMAAGAATAAELQRPAPGQLQSIAILKRMRLVFVFLRHSGAMKRALPT